MTAVTVDQHSSASESGSKTYSTNLTITAGATLLLVFEYNGGNGCGTPTGVTYNGVAMTMVPGSSVVETNNCETSIWYMISPPTGASHTATVTISDFPGYAAVFAVSFNNTSTSTPYAGVTTNDGTNQGPATLGLSGAVSGVDLYAAVGAIGATAGTDAQTTIESQQNINSYGSAFCSDCLGSGSGSFSLTFGGTLGSHWAYSGLVVKGVSVTYTGTAAITEGADAVAGVGNFVAMPGGYVAAAVQTAIYAGSGFALQQIATPISAIGDTWFTTLTSPGGYIPQPQFDSTVVVFSGGDNSRQSFQAELYRAGTQVFDGPGTVWVNEIPPIWSAVVIPGLNVGQPMVPFNLNSVCVSTEGDTLTFAVASGALPPGLSLSVAGLITGTPTAVPPNPGGGPVVFFVTFSATDSTGSIVGQTLSGLTGLSVSTLLPCLPPATKQVGFGGNIWGASGGSAVPVNASTPWLKSLSYGTAQANALDTQTGLSVLAEASTAFRPLTASVCSVPSTPQVG
jgi:hypothetical protein